MKIQDLIDICTIHTDITVWIEKFNGIYNCKYKCKFRSYDFYQLKLFEFRDDEENTMFIDTVKLEQYDIFLIYPSGLNELEIILE